jgi:thioredoxin reductase (NADPH)
MADDEAIPNLDAPDIALFEAAGTRRSVVAGDYLYREGDSAYDFYVLVSAEVEIVLRTDSGEQLIAQHGPGRFLGELNMLTGQRVFASARVVEAGDVIAVPRAELRRVMTTNPRLGDSILAAFLARRARLISGAGSSSSRVIGSRFSPETMRLREFLSCTN